MNSARDSIDNEARKDPRRLEAEIDQQRDSIGNLVDALGSKLSPGQLVDQVIGAGNGTAGDFARNLGNVVKANPVPALLATAGLAWLYASRNSPAPVPALTHGAYGTDHGRQNGFGEGLRDKASHLREDAAHLREGAAESWNNATTRVGDVAHGIGERAHQAADSVREQSRKAGDGLNHMLHDNPMAAGAIAVSIGALLGALLPMSEQENRLMGETGDTLRGKAGEVADSVREKGAEAVHELSEAAQGHPGGAKSATGQPAGSARA